MVSNSYLYHQTASILAANRAKKPIRNPSQPDLWPGFADFLAPGKPHQDCAHPSMFSADRSICKVCHLPLAMPNPPGQSRSLMLPLFIDHSHSIVCEIYYSRYSTAYDYKYKCVQHLCNHFCSTISI